MDDWFFKGLLILGMVAIIIVAINAEDTSYKLKQCRQTHNVYKCEVQYVPVKGE